MEPLRLFHPTVYVISQGLNTASIVSNYSHSSDNIVNTSRVDQANADPPEQSQTPMLRSANKLIETN